MPQILAIDPVLFRSSDFPLGVESIQPYNVTFNPGDIVELSATQNKYSFDYYQVWPPHQVVESDNFYPTM